MPDFVWRAASAAGGVVNGSSTATSESALLRQLREQGLTPLAILPQSSAAAAISGKSVSGVNLGTALTTRSAKGPVKPADILALTSELSIMLKAGLALDNALRVLMDMSHKAAVTLLLKDILDAVKGGAPLSRALALHHGFFGDFYINMIRSGEASGQMSAVLERLVEHMERQRALRENVVSATIYPAILLAVAALSLIVMLGFVVPQFEKLFTDMGDALPLPTQWVMAVGHAFKSYGVAIAIGCIGAGTLLMRWGRSPAGMRWWQGRILGVPLVGRLTLKYQLTLFSRSLGTLLGNGVPMLTALHIATETVSNGALQAALAKVAPVVKEGGKVVDAVTATGIFEPLAINLIRVGEETGRIGPMMLELSGILNREVETGIKRLLTLVEPILILVLGILIAAIIVSILLGILSVNELAV